MKDFKIGDLVRVRVKYSSDIVIREVVGIEDGYLLFDDGSDALKEHCYKATLAQISDFYHKKFLEERAKNQPAPKGKMIRIQDTLVNTDLVIYATLEQDKHFIRGEHFRIIVSFLHTGNQVFSFTTREEREFYFNLLGEA